MQIRSICAELEVPTHLVDMQIAKLFREVDEVEYALYRKLQWGDEPIEIKENNNV